MGEVYSQPNAGNLEKNKAPCRKTERHATQDRQMYNIYAWQRINKTAKRTNAHKALNI